MKREVFNRWLFGILAVIELIAMTGCNGSQSQAPTAEQIRPETQNEVDISTDDAAFSLTVLDVGQGLSVLVKAGNDCLLYDGGGRGASSYVVSYLQQNDVTELDWLVASHYDEDHISGLVGVLNTISVDQALMPDYSTDTQIYQSLQNSLEEKSVPVTHPTQGESFTLGDAEIQVVGPFDYTYDSDNSNSICLKICYGNFSCLLTGDAEQDAEHDMIASEQDLTCDVYVVGHHGSSSSTSEELLNAASPEYAVLSVGADNRYGHPAEQTMKALQNHGVELYRTDRQVEITVYANKEHFWFNTPPSEDWSAGKQTAPDTPLATTISDDAKYVLNIHTKKFHLPACPSVNQMNEKNKSFADETREELIARGYTPCGQCDP